MPSQFHQRYFQKQSCVSTLLYHFVPLCFAGLTVGLARIALICCQIALIMSQNNQYCFMCVGTQFWKSLEGSSGSTALKIHTQSTHMHRSEHYICISRVGCLVFYFGKNKIVRSKFFFKLLKLSRLFE